MLTAIRRSRSVGSPEAAAQMPLDPMAVEVADTTLKEAAVRRTTLTLRHNSQAEALVETGAGVGKVYIQVLGAEGAERFNSRRLDR